jgi:hypothetical protein
VWVQQSGEYPRKVRILPVMPGLTPSSDTVISPSDQSAMDRVWDYLYEMLYDLDENVVPMESPGLGQ